MKCSPLSIHHTPRCTSCICCKYFGTNQVQPQLENLLQAAHRPERVRQREWEEGKGGVASGSRQLDWLMFSPKAVRFALKWGAKKDQPKKVAICFLQVFSISMRPPSRLLPLAVCQTYFIFIYNNLITAKSGGERGGENGRNLMKLSEFLVQIDFN